MDHKSLATQQINCEKHPFFSDQDPCWNCQGLTVSEFTRMMCQAPFTSRYPSFSDSTRQPQTTIREKVFSYRS